MAQLGAMSKVHRMQFTVMRSDQGIYDFLGINSPCLLKVKDDNKCEEASHKEGNTDTC